MKVAFFTGFFLGFSLIMAIGAQNLFVIRQGIIGKHILFVVLFCAISDAILISIGVAGISFLFKGFINSISKILYVLSAIWLFIYGFIRLISAIKCNYNLLIENNSSQSLFKTISIISFLTFANPHVYLDTVVLIGSISLQFFGTDRFIFALGCILASFTFFFTIGYGSRLIQPVMKRNLSWQILDIITAIIMFIIAIRLAMSGYLI